MKQFFSCLALAALPALCASNQGVEATVAPITLYTDFQQAVPQAVMDTVRSEVAWKGRAYSTAKRANESSSSK